MNMGKVQIKYKIHKNTQNISISLMNLQGNTCVGIQLISSIQLAYTHSLLLKLTGIVG